PECQLFSVHVIRKILCLMVENSSGKEKKSKLTSLKIRSATDFYPSGREFSPLLTRDFLSD
ncbi:hypothetical protein, partial [Porphyromonas macacae]|uniref:hypothetical protein n=1 Tax=Porphyromonas macacae TaxID=28115 RepID=UPI001F3CD387